MDITHLKEVAGSNAKDYAAEAIHTPHVLKALLHIDMGLVKYIEKTLGKDYFYMQEWADVHMQLLPRVARSTAPLEWADDALAVLDEADNYRI